MDPSNIREKIGRFRILIIGRANAGKTTILQRICNTRGNPEIYNGAGKKIDPAVLTSSRERGEHNIENELVFQSNPGFVFHDSRGFEAGSESEFDKVKAFIARRSNETRLKDRLHAIWYCIPMDQESRSFTTGEIKFFSQCNTGSIPVMVLFTKFDALYDVAYTELKSKGVPLRDARELAPMHAEESFFSGPQMKFLKDFQWPPKCCVCLSNMNKDGVDCRPLIEHTARTLDNEVVKQLFISTQRTNLELCVKYAVEKTVPDIFNPAKTTEGRHEMIIKRSSIWFPHIYTVGPWDVDDDVFHGGPGVYDAGGFVHDDFYGYVVDELSLNVPASHWQKLLRSHCVDMQSRLLSVASGSSPLENNVQLMSAAVIIFEHSFYIFEKQRYLPDKQKSVPSFIVALEQYIASPHAAAVREGVSVAVQLYEEAATAAARAYDEAVTTATHTYQGKPSTWTAKLPFEPFKKKAQKAFERSKEKEKEAFERSKKKEKESLRSQAMAELIKTILEITSNHRLPRP